MSGIKPVVVALILFTGITFLLETLGVSYGKTDVSSVVLFVLVVVIHFLFTRMLKKKLSSVFLIIISAVLGIAVGIVEEMLFI